MHNLLLQRLTATIGPPVTNATRTPLLAMAFIVASACVPAAMAECTWPGKDAIPPVLVPPVGSTVTCTGEEPGVYVSEVPLITVEVSADASIGGVELLGSTTTVINYGAVRDDGAYEGFGVSQAEYATLLNYGTIAPGVVFFGSGYTASNFGTITSTLAGDEFYPTGALFSLQTGDGTMVNAASEEGTGVIRTTADYNAGIVLRDPVGSNLIENQAFLPGEGPLQRASISTEGFGSPGIYVTNDASEGTLEIGNGGLIETLGDESAGISVYPLYEEIPLSHSARVLNDGYGSISTAGADSQGILAYAGDVEVTNRGAILTRGWDSAGIEAIGLTRVRVWNTYGAALVTEGMTFSPGIAILGIAPVDFLHSVLNEGDISTLGADSPGIVVFGGPHTVASECYAEPGCRSSITTAGDGSSGIQLGVIEPGLDVHLPSNAGSVYNGGTISTQGAFAAGISVLGRENAITNNPGGELLTIGEGSPGIQVVHNDPDNPGTGSNEVYNHGLIHTEGNVSPGIVSTGTLTGVWNYDRIETAGPDSAGIEMHGYGSEAENFGIIFTVGNSSPGIAAEGDYSELRNHEYIETMGTRSHGIDLTGQYGVASNRDLIRTWGENAYGMDLNMREGSAANTGSIETIGISAHGIQYQASYLDPLNNIYNSGGISTAGDGAHGINALYSTYAIDNYGAISTAGEGAHGIRLRSIEVTEPVLPETTLFNNGDIFVSGAGSIGVSIERKLFEETTLENTVSGRISSPGVAIAGGDGYENLINRGIIDGDILLGGALDTIINDGVINGDVNLGDSGDDFYRGAGSAVNGIVDAGEGDEEFREDMLTLLTVSGNEVVDGSRYVNFEQTLVGGAGAMTLNGTLNTDLTTINGVTLYVAGRLESALASVNGGGVRVLDGGVLGGNGSVGADVDLLADGSASPGESIGSLMIEGDLFLNGGILEFEADSLLDADSLFVGGDATFSDGFIDVILGFTPAPEDVLDFLIIQGTLEILDGFDGVRGIAAAGSGVALGTPFTVALGNQLLQGIVTSAVPIPPSVWLFLAGLLGLVGVARRKQRIPPPAAHSKRC